MLAGAVGGRLLWAFAILSSQPADPEPGAFVRPKKQFGGLAMTRPLWYEAVKCPPTQRVRGPVAQPDRATVS
jgi:hypothetical protein